jgi:hypothetical protein
MDVDWLQKPCGQVICHEYTRSERRVRFSEKDRNRNKPFTFSIKRLSQERAGVCIIGSV